MSLAETYAAATAWIVVSRATADTSCIGRQLVGVIAPEKGPCPAALAAPPTARTTTAIATTAGRIVRIGRAFTSPCSFGRPKETRGIVPEISRFLNLPKKEKGYLILN